MISDLDMLPIEFCLLRLTWRGMVLTSKALNAQWLALSEPAAFIVHRAHALEKGDMLVDPKLLFRDE